MKLRWRKSLFSEFITISFRKSHIAHFELRVATHIDGNWAIWITVVHDMIRLDQAFELLNSRSCLGDLKSVVMKSNVVKVLQPQHSQHFMEFHVGSLSFTTFASLSHINKESFKLLTEHHVSLINVTRVGDLHSFTGVLGIWLSFDRVSNKCVI